MEVQAAMETDLGRNAAAFRALKKALVENPSYIYETIEQHLQTDFESRPSRPGQPLGGASIRGWVESRSRIQYYPQQIRWTWAAAGVWDCLIREDYKQARARAALMVAAADQAAIDDGNWLLASVAFLESPAPFHAFSQRQAPSAHDLQHSVLLDPKWIEVFVSHVKEMGGYQEAKKRLGRPQAALPSAEASDRDGARAKANAKAKCSLRGGCLNSDDAEKLACDQPYVEEAHPVNHDEPRNLRSPIRLPGATAGTYSGQKLFMAFIRFLLQSRSGLALFARSFLCLTREQDDVPAPTECFSGRGGFPMPPPYPEAMRKKWTASVRSLLGKR